MDNKTQELIKEYATNVDEINRLKKRNRVIFEEVALDLHVIKPGAIVQEIEWHIETPTGRRYIVTRLDVSHSLGVTGAPDLKGKQLKKDGEPALRPSTSIYGRYRVIKP